MRLIAICLTLISVVIAGPCPPAGYPYPPPTNISRGSIIDQAAANLTLTLNTVLANSSILPYLDTNSTSFSIDVYHAQHNRSILTFHHTAPSLSQSNLGVKKVDSDTVYRIASISKLWTVYTYLVTIGDTSFYDPITKYIPELATYVEQHPVGTNNKNISIDVFDWAQMTISSLISHLAGVPQDPGLSPLVDAGFASAGLPKVPPVNGSFCGDPAILQWPCDRAAFFQNILSRHPVLAPYRSATYQDTGFILVAYALENITNIPFPQLFQDNFINKLKLNSTYYSQPPTNSSSIIPTNASTSWYFADLRDGAPAGGYYSTLNDIQRVGRSILTSSILLPTQIRRWMKPLSFLSESQGIGAPWEIVRAPTVSPSWIYTKSGNLPTYASLMALLPDHDIGFTILSAGPTASATTSILADIISATFIASLEDAARDETSSLYSGLYRDPITNSSLQLTTSPTQTGLVATSFIYNGTNALDLIAEFQGINLTTSAVTMNLYPTGLSSEDGKTDIIAWRALFTTTPRTGPTSIPKGVVAPFTSACWSWASLDGPLVYGGVALNEFAFRVDAETGEAVAVEARGFRTLMQKV